MGHDADMGVEMTMEIGCCPPIKLPPRRGCRRRRQLESGGCELAKYRSNNALLCKDTVSVALRGGTLLLTGHLLGPFRQCPVPVTVLAIIIAL